MIALTISISISVKPRRLLRARPFSALRNTRTVPSPADLRYFPSDPAGASSASELSPERELEEFERLKPRLREVWNAIALRDEEPHTSVVVPSLTLDQSELRKLDGVELLRGAASLPPDPPPQSAGPRRLRHVAARPPAHPRVLLPASRRHPREPRPRPADAPLRPRRLAPLAHGEDPRAAAAHRADPRGDRRPVAGLPHGLQLDAARAAPRRPPRHPAERRRPGALPSRDEIGLPKGLPRSRHRLPGGIRGPRRRRGCRRRPSSS